MDIDKEDDDSEDEDGNDDEPYMVDQRFDLSRL